MCNLYLFLFVYLYHIYLIYLVFSYLMNLYRYQYKYNNKLSESSSGEGFSFRSRFRGSGGGVPRRYLSGGSSLFGFIAWPRFFIENQILVQVRCVSETQLFVRFLSDRSEQILKIDGLYTGLCVLGLKRRRRDHDSVSFEKNKTSTGL